MAGLGHLFSPIKMGPMEVDEFLERQAPVGHQTLVVGGDQIGLQVADYLSERGMEVWLAEPDRHLAAKMAMADELYLLQRVMLERSLRLYRGAQQVRILPFDEGQIVDRDGQENRADIDTIVLASQRRPNADLAATAQGRGIETHLAGDARRFAGEDQGTVFAAIADGYDVGRHI